MNLAVNARDAMPPGGRLTIETQNVDLDDACAVPRRGASPGRYVMLSVSDTGCGMDARDAGPRLRAVLHHQGAGQGHRAWAWPSFTAFVKQGGGFIQVHSEPGQGSTFRVYLPRMQDGADGEPRQRPRPPLPRGSERVLLVEDEPSVRAMALHVLRCCGYQTLEAADGEEAVRVATEHNGPIDLLLTDVVLPRMGGRELMERLSATRPGLPVLFISGYTEDEVLRHGVSQAEVAFLQKPFTPLDLAQKVSRGAGCVKTTQ